MIPALFLRFPPAENLSDRIFRLIPSAVIAGKIMDEDGQPLSGTMVSAMREVYTEGKRKLQSQSMTGTDDLGEFRLFGLSPGRYILSALYSPTNGDRVSTISRIWAKAKAIGAT